MTSEERIWKLLCMAREVKCKGRINMNSVPIQYLSKLKTISALKVLVVFLAMRDKLGKDQFNYSVPSISEDSGMSQNAVRNGIKELVSLNFIQVVELHNDKSNVYRIVLTPSKSEVVGGAKSEVDTPAKVESPSKSEVAKTRAEYRFAVAGRKKKEEKQEEEINNNINNIDFNNINIYTEDINSLSVINTNIFMTDKELGKLARRILNEVYLPLSRNGKQDTRFFAMQMRCLKDLLVDYRTEQVVAAIKYWTEINPTPNGLTSLHFLKYKRKNRQGVMVSNVLIALDYYKQQFLANAHEFKKDEIEKKLADKAQREQEEKEAAAKRAEEVAQMKPEEFISGMMNRFKLNLKKDE